MKGEIGIQLLIYVEGIIDQLFMEKIILPEIKTKTTVIPLKPNSKSGKTAPQKIKSALNSKRKGFIDLIVLIDSDANNYGGWNKNTKKQRIDQFSKEMGIKPNQIQKSIAFAVIEIESWYLAGLDMNARKKLKFKKSKGLTTDNLSKQDFYNLCHKEPDIAFYSEIIEHYKIQEARKNNVSFDQFMNQIKHHL
ncbi:MAG: hypothetical protein D6732_26540 [Methanobacteriota archaeon]|nr:MAG: hypothetical protein D6732_26540 [Euryarchaeota archaeon]